MQTFKDSSGREWTFRVTVGAIARVKGSLGINLADPQLGEPPLLTRLETDQELLASTMYALLAPDIEAAGLTPDKFAECLDGEAFGAAHDAFWEELRDFFQKSKRSNLAEMISAQLRVLRKATEASATRVQALNIDKLVEKAFGADVGNSPASVGLTPQT